MTEEDEAKIADTTWSRLAEARRRSKLRKTLIGRTLGIDDLELALGRTSSSRKRALESPVPNATATSTSTAFLKGTQSRNPHNDYSQHFVDSGQRPQNFIRDVGLKDRFEEYPKLRELIKLKNRLVADTAHPPMYLKASSSSSVNVEMKALEQKFDVILIEPPLIDWERVMALDVGHVAAQRAFVFLWCGNSDGLDLGRVCLQKWGFRRCEDICWIKTNHGDGEKAIKGVLEPKAVFQRTKEHCLMGIKGTVRRSTDGDFIHANVDIDLIIDEEAEEKPVEMFHIIEHFCLGRRRLHLFGNDCAIRPGWFTLGPALSSSNYDAAVLAGYYQGDLTTGCTERIENLRPKSPPPKIGGRGGGSGNRKLRGH